MSVNLALAWRASREEVATLHGVLSLVALAVLPPTMLTLAAAAADVTAFSIAITWRQRWQYQLLVGAAAAVVQYRRVYARQRFNPLLFAAHLLN